MKKKFIVLNTACTGKHIVRYLMQERFFADEHSIKNKSRIDLGLCGFQEGLFCMRNKTGSQTLDEVYQGGVGWYYDGMDRTYNLVIKFLPNVLNKDKLNTMTELTGKKNRNNCHSDSWNEKLHIQSYQE